MGVEINGLDGVEKTIKRKFSSLAIKEAENRALKKGGNMLRDKIEDALFATGDTGRLARDTSFKEPEIIGGELTSKIYWKAGKGHHGSLAHLNENGHYDKAGKWVRPTGIGKINQTITLNREEYYRLIKKELDK